MKKIIRMTESDLHNIVTKSVKKAVNEAVDYGWEVTSEDANRAYEFACDRMGKETVDDAIVQSLSSDELAESLAYIFRMYDFTDWDEYNEDEDMF